MSGLNSVRPNFSRSGTKVIFVKSSPRYASICGADLTVMFALHVWE